MEVSFVGNDPNDMDAMLLADYSLLHVTRIQPSGDITHLSSAGGLGLCVVVEWFIEINSFNARQINIYCRSRH